MVFACLVLLHVGCGGFWAYCLHACISIITIQSNPILWSLHAWYSAYQSNPTVCMHASKCGGRPVGHEERDQTACFTKKQNKTKNDTGPRGTRCPDPLAVRCGWGFASQVSVTKYRGALAVGTFVLPPGSLAVGSFVLWFISLIFASFQKTI